ncbi:MAG: thioredoxin [Firmicutes bacterium]|nr:thioredoxin [Bacillota bacterium]
MNNDIKILTDANFKSVTGEDKVSLVDFWAPWCGPCRMLTPTIDQLAVEFGDKANICKADVDIAEETAKEFGIMTVPTLMIFKSGKLLETMVGLRQKAQIAEAISKHI